MAIRIPIGQIKDGNNEFDLNISAQEIGLDENFLKGNINAFVKAEKISNQLDLEINLSGVMKLECDRCLEIYESSFTTKFELVYIVRSNDQGVEDDEYVRSYSAHMRYIDITKDVRDFVELAIPMRKVPEEKEDGSCSWCTKPKDYWKSIIIEKEDED